MKYKKIPQNYIEVCLDRLTRFKPVCEKYERVFFDIASKFLIHNGPTNGASKFHINDGLCEIVSEIFNSSIPYDYDPFLSDLLIAEEHACFHIDEYEEKYLKSGLNITGAIKYINKETLPINLKRLNYIEKTRNAPPEFLRKENALLFPIKKIILTEGTTEEILLPKIAQNFGFDFYKEGVFLLGAGGKNQVARKYYKMSDEIKLPIFVLLDNDANETKELILKKIRECDDIYVIKSGEFEDILPLNLIIESINKNFKNYNQCSKSDFNPFDKMTKNLHNIYKNKGFGEYKKADFAKIVENCLMNATNLGVSSEIEDIISRIKNIN